MEILHRIPGGYYGNDPGTLPHAPGRGRVVVDPEKVVEAITWLRKRATITRTWIECTPNPSFGIAYELRRSMPRMGVRP